MLTRRHFIQTTTALFSASVSSPLLADTWPAEAQKAEWDAQVTPPGFDPATSNPWGLHPRFLPQRVVAKPGLVPGDIHVDAVARYLYHIEESGTAMRYGVAIARGNLYETRGLHDQTQGEVAALDADPEHDRAGSGKRTMGRRDGTRPRKRFGITSHLSVRRRPRHLSSNTRHALSAKYRRSSQFGLRADGHGSH